MKPLLRRIVLCLAALAVSFPTAAQSLTERVDKVFAEYDKPDSPGCALGVVRDGKLFYTRGYGMASLEHSVSITSKTVFYIGSTSKQFTAASILLAADQGKLSLDDNIRKYVPEIPDYGAPITIRHLLHHTSGLRDALTLMALADRPLENVATVGDYLALLGRQKELNFTPGAEHLYSNSGYFLMGVIIQRATGKSLRQFADETIFKPLGMTNTHFHDDRRMIVKNRAAGYSRTAPGQFVLNWYLNFEKVGDGGLLTTIEDLALWDQNFYADKLSGGTLPRRQYVQGKLNDGFTISYAHGLTVGTYRGIPAVSHGGALMGFRAELLRFPEQKFSVICLCNVAQAVPTSLARQVADVYLEDVFKQAGASEPASVTLTGAQLSALAGNYRDASTRALRRVAVREGRLTIDNAPLLALTATSFRTVPGTRADFEAATRSSPRRLRVTQPGLPPRTFEAIEMLPPSDVNWPDYAGMYHSEELDVTYEFALREGALALLEADGTPVRLDPTTRDEFLLRGRGATLAFLRDAQGRVTGLDIYADRVRRIRFVKKGA